MKRLLYITKNFPPERGTRRIEAVYKILSRIKGISCTAVTAAAQEKNDPGVKHIKQLFKDRVGKKNIVYKNAQPKIKIFDKAFIGWQPVVFFSILFKKYDLVFCTCPQFANIALGFLYKFFHFGKPRLIIDYRDFFSFNPGFRNNLAKKVINVYERLVLAWTDRILVTTASMKKILEKKMGTKKKRPIITVRNYMMSDDIDYLDTIDKEEIEKSIDSSFDKKSFYHLGYVGVLNSGRDPGRLLGIVKQKIEGKQAVLHFVGVNETEQEAILNNARMLKLDTSLLLFHGVVDRKTSLQYMKYFDGLVLLINDQIKINEGYGIPGKIYDYGVVNNNIFADQATYNNLSSDLECDVLEQYEGYVNFKLKETTPLDTVLLEALGEMISG